MAADISHLVDPSELMNRRSAARLCGVKPATIGDYARRELLRVILVDGRDYYLRSEVLTLPPPQPGHTRARASEGEALAAVLQVADVLGRLPNKIEYQQSGAPYLHALGDYYGSWNKVCKAAHQKGEPFWKMVPCQQCRRPFTARIGPNLLPITETCSYLCQKDAERGLPAAQVFNGETFKLRSDGYYRSSRDSRMLQHAVWSFHHGRVPKTHRLCFIDGDKTNCRIENLYIRKVTPNPPCAESGCPKKGWGEKKWCKAHYLQRRSE